MKEMENEACDDIEKSALKVIDKAEKRSRQWRSCKKWCLNLLRKRRRGMRWNISYLGDSGEREVKA